MEIFSSSGLVAVVKQFSKRIMRVVANHAGPVKEIEKRFGFPEVKLHSTKNICESSPSTIEFSDSIQRDSESTPDKNGAGDCDEEGLEEIKAAIADAPFMQDSDEPESRLFSEPPVSDKFSATIARTILERLRNLDIPLSKEVLHRIAKTPQAQLERNISALEEESATKGLLSPIAAFKYFVTHNCQPRNDRQAWWNSAGVALGRERRDQLIQAVFEYLGEVVVMFTNGRRLPLAQAQVMSWEAIAALGDEP